MTPGRLVAATLSLLLGVSGCVGSTADPVGNGPNYVAQLRAERRADVADIIDSATAVLWQGRPDVRILVAVRREGSDLTVDSLTVGLPSRESLVERYGPQPGTGEVPADAEPLPRSPGLP